MTTPRKNVRTKAKNKKTRCTGIHSNKVWKEYQKTYDKYGSKFSRNMDVKSFSHFVFIE